MDIPTFLYVTAGISALLLICGIVAVILIIFLLQEIKLELQGIELELRYVNEYNNSKSD